MRIARLLPPKPGGAYERALKKLAKDYPQVASDAQSVLAQFVGPNAFPVPCPPKAFQLPAVSREVLKIRVGSSDQNKGKSGGFRLLLANKGNDAWQPLVIYAKAQTEDLPRPRVLELIEEELSDEPDPFGEPTAAESPADPKPVPLPAARPLLPSSPVPALTLDQLAAHLDELAQLAPGWLDGEGPALSAEGLAWARGLLLRAHAAGVPVPYLYPTVEGELSAEWPLGRWTVSATLDLTTRGAYLHATDLQSDAAEERECSLAGPEGEAALVAFVAGFAPLPAPRRSPDATAPTTGRQRGAMPSVLVLWSCGRRQLELHTDGAERVAVLLDAGRVVGLWRLPRRPAP